MAELRNNAERFIVSFKKTFISREKEYTIYQSILPDDHRWFKAEAKYTEYLCSKNYFVSVTDISEEKKFEEQLLNKTRELENFFSVNLDLLCIANTKGAFLKVNKEWETILGYSKAAGERTWATALMPVFREGRVAYIVGSSQDITEKKQAEEALKENEERFRILSHVTMEGIIIHKNGIVRDLNHSFSRMLGYKREELHNRRIMDCNDHFVRIIGSSREMIVGLNVLNLPDKKLVAAMKGALQGDVTSYEDDYKSITADKVTPVRGIFEPMRTDNQGIIGGVGIIEDISLRKKLETALISEKKLLETTLISVGYGVISTNDKGEIVFLNKMAESLTGWTQEEAQGRYIEDVFWIINEFTREKCENIVLNVLKTGKIMELANHTILISKDGFERPIEDSAAPIVLENGKIIGVVLVFRDFSEKKHKQEEILYLSYHDQLTGLYNRRFYEEELKRLDTKRNLPMTIVMADVNGLKLINDSFGHALGDQFLKKAADVINKGCRIDDIVARIGGDEFVILLPNTDGIEAEKIIKRIKAIAAEEKIDSFDVSISFGYSVKNNEEETIQEILKNAEDLMYRNKLYESSSMRSKTINLIMNTLYEKSHRELLHSKRVSKICETFAAKMNFDKDNVNQIRIAGLMHDIGKMGIDGEILNKPDSLNYEEWKEIERHPEVGYRILSSANEFLEIAKYVLEHQERWDGNYRCC